MPDVTQMIADAAMAAGVDPGLALSVAIEESGLNQSAVSPKGAIGVFQLEPQTAAELGVDPRDLQQNISGGVRYLAQQLARFGGDTAKALAAYDWGPSAVTGAIAQWGANWLAHAPAETRKYVADILAAGGSFTATVNVPGAVVQAVTNPAQIDPRTALLLLGIAIGTYLLAKEVFS